MGTIFFTVIWGVVCGILAKKKNRNVAGWVVLGVFFGLIPLIVLAYLQPLKPNQQNNNANNCVDAWNCVNCGVQVGGDAQFCPNCGTARPQIASQSQESAVAQEETSNEWTCPSCKNKNPDDATYCKHCYSNRPKE